VICTSAQ